MIGRTHWTLHLQRTSALQEAATSFRALRLPIDCIKDHVREGIRGVDASVENPGCRREAFDRRQASGDIRQSPISDLRISRRIRMHNLVGNPLAQEILVKRQENVHEGGRRRGAVRREFHRGALDPPVSSEPGCPGGNAF